jgi:hypothetical protein
MDKREQTNSELENSLGSNLVFLHKNNNLDNELQKFEDVSSLQNSGSVNNYNINVNIDKSTNTSGERTKTETKNIIQNVIKNNNTNNIEDLKKNYTTNYDDVSDKSYVNIIDNKIENKNILKDDFIPTTNLKNEYINIVNTEQSGMPINNDSGGFIPEESKNITNISNLSKTTENNSNTNSTNNSYSFENKENKLSINQNTDKIDSNSNTNTSVYSNILNNGNNSYSFENKENKLSINQNTDKIDSNSNTSVYSNILNNGNNSYSFENKENNNVNNVINSENVNLQNINEVNYENGFVRNYSYSEKNGNTTNNITNENTYSLNDIIKNSLEIEKPTENMNNGIFTPDQISNQRNLYETNNYQNIQTVKNTSFYDNIESETRNFKLEKEKQKDMAERTAIQMSRIKSSDKSEDEKQAQEMNESLRDSRGTPSSIVQAGNYDSPGYSHINTPHINDVDNIMLKMNSPPVWRTVLG